MSTERKREEPKGTSSFEEALSRLERIVKELEGGAGTLDTSIALYEEGRSLVQLCTKKLDEAQGRIERLVRTDAGLRTEAAGPTDAVGRAEAPAGGEAGEEVPAGGESSEDGSPSEVLGDDGLPF